MGSRWSGRRKIEYDGVNIWTADAQQLPRKLWSFYFARNAVSGLEPDGTSLQVLVDHGLVVTTYFLKSSGYGGDWVVRVKVEEEKKPLKKITEEGRTQSVFFYIVTRLEE
ncbi:unnamed protein product [Calypogeia fissa]